MPTNGMTINSLNTVSSLTAQDEVPVWDKEASGEPTQKITAQNMTNSVKTLGSLVNTTEMNNAIAQSTADVIRTGDVVNNLTSTATNAPLSANMGKELNSKITQNGTANNRLVVCNPTATFANGDAYIDVSSYIPSGYRVSIPFAVVENSTTLAVTGCVVNGDNDNTILVRLSNRSYAGSISMHLMISCVPV